MLKPTFYSSRASVHLLPLLTDSSSLPFALNFYSYVLVLFLFSIQVCKQLSYCCCICSGQAVRSLSHVLCKYWWEGEKKLTHHSLISLLVQCEERKRFALPCTIPIFPSLSSSTLMKDRCTF